MGYNNLTQVLENQAQHSPIANLNILVHLATAIPKQDESLLMPLIAKRILQIADWRLLRADFGGVEFMCKAGRRSCVSEF